MIQLDYSDTRPLYEQIKDKLKTLIIRGILMTHQQLPSIRDMASNLTLNPNTIQKAYRDLELEGYIYSVRGKGSFVAEMSQKLKEGQQAQMKAQLQEVLIAMQHLGITLQEALAWVEAIYDAEGDNSMIQVENLSKSFSEFKAIDHLSLNVKKGSVYGLIGPNGAGKTTLIKLINGIFKSNTGSIRIDGQEICENERIKERLIYVSDDLYYFSMATIKDLAQLYAGIYPNWNQDRFERLKSIFPMDEKRRLIRLSKGMQKQVAFWLGLCTMPDLMILDEPVDGLDPVMRRRVWNLMLQDVAERQMTVLLSSHNLRELEDVCDHVGIIHQGKMLLEKNLDEAKSNIYKIQVAFPNDQEEASIQALQTGFVILHQENFGSVWRLIIKGEQNIVMDFIKGLNPMILDWLPLTLEEVFIYELGGIGYDIANIIL